MKRKGYLLLNSLIYFLALALLLSALFSIAYSSARLYRASRDYITIKEIADHAENIIQYNTENIGGIIGFKTRTGIEDKEGFVKTSEIGYVVFNSQSGVYQSRGLAIYHSENIKNHPSKAISLGVFYGNKFQLSYYADNMFTKFDFYEDGSIKTMYIKINYRLNKAFYKQIIKVHLPEVKDPPASFLNSSDL